jgi:Calcineurin-like phosphoesterase
MVTAIFTDPHEHPKFIDTVEAVANDVDSVIINGDIVDSYDGLVNTEPVLKWLGKKLENPGKFQFNLGNHDLHYISSHKQLRCSGYKQERQRLVNKHIDKTLWSKVGLFKQVDKWIVSHAGMHPYVFPEPYDTYTIETLQSLSKRAMQSLAVYSDHLDPLLAAGRARGGSECYGGVIWLDWYDEFVPMGNINQIVGHTYGSAVRYKTNGTYPVISENICFDTVFRNYLLVENSQVTVKTIGENKP